MKQRSLQFTDYIVRQKLAYAAWTRFERLQCFKYIYIFIHQNGSQKKKKIHTYKNIQQAETEAEIKNKHMHNMHKG